MLNAKTLTSWVLIGTGWGDIARHNNAIMVKLRR